MEAERKEPKRGTKVHYQSTSINNECLQQSAHDGVLFSSTPCCTSFFDMKEMN